jgi:hypothetical protein
MYFSYLVSVCLVVEQEEGQPRAESGSEVSLHVILATP